MMSNEDILGKDLFIDIFTTNDVRISSKNDLQTISGRDNLKQAIINRLRTFKGELALHPEYGSRLKLLIGFPPNEQTLLLAKKYVYEALLQEPRIKEVTDINVYFDTNDVRVLHIDITVIPIDSNEELNIVFPYILQG